MDHFQEEFKRGEVLGELKKQSGLKRFFKKVFYKEAAASKVTKEEERRCAIVNLEIQDIEDSESRNGKLLGV